MVGFAPVGSFPQRGLDRLILTTIDYLARRTQTRSPDRLECVVEHRRVLRTLKLVLFGTPRLLLQTVRLTAKCPPKSGLLSLLRSAEVFRHAPSDRVSCHHRFITR